MATASTIKPVPIAPWFQKQFVGKDNRLNPRFFWRNKGLPRKPVKDVLKRLGKECAINDFMLAFTPFTVKIGKGNHDHFAEIEEWLGENTRGPWFYWKKNYGGDLGVQSVIGFATERDATVFDMYYQLMGFDMDDNNAD